MRTPSACRWAITSSSGVRVGKHRSPDPAVAWRTLESTTVPTSCTLIFCVPKCSAYRWGDTLLRAQLRTALHDAGYTVDEADNGRDAQFLGEAEAVDAVVLDLGLPVVDGISVLKRWRAQGATCRC